MTSGYKERELLRRDLRTWADYFANPLIVARDRGATVPGSAARDQALNSLRLAAWLIAATHGWVMRRSTDMA